MKGSLLRESVKPRGSTPVVSQSELHMGRDSCRDSCQNVSERPVPFQEILKEFFQNAGGRGRP